MKTRPEEIKPKKIRLGFLASGRGSNMLAIIDNCKAGKLNAEPVVVISNNADAGALEYAREAGIPAFHLSINTHADPSRLDDEITNTLKFHEVDWLILAGYMKKIGQRLLGEFRGKILNIHPSLLPRHGGQGMYGLHVHEAVLASGESETGVTIHMVDGEYDQGRILAQSSVPVEKDDTPESLAARVLIVEHELYSDTLREIIGGRISL
ncbi:MAG: phosphoribosylglycinamide formyltransferase [Gammaproteobacteria bacterium]